MTNGSKEGRGVVAARPPRAVEVGTTILDEGGNAFDAAVATAFAQMALDPWMSGPGGLGTAMVHDADRNETKAVQFYARAGERVRSDQWVDEGGERLSPLSHWLLFDDYRNELGYSAVGVPGAVAGLDTIHDRYCTLPWERLVAPAVDVAADGFRIAPHHHSYWSEPLFPGLPDGPTRLGKTDASATLFLDEDGDPLTPGTWFTNPDLADTLETVAVEGAESFYTGEIAAKIADDLAANDAYVTADDLAAYEPRVVDPLSIEYRGHRIVSEPPPGGGLAVLEVLRLLDSYDRSDLPHNSAAHLRRLTGAMCAAQNDVRRVLGDPEFADVPTEALLSDEHVESKRRTIESGNYEQLGASEPEDNTTQITAADEDGNLISLTQTLGTGSGVVTPGLGFVYNSAMAYFTLDDPDHPNALAPRKARRSPLAPTVVFDPDGTPTACVGAPGGYKIVSAVVQATCNLLDYGMTPYEAVGAPRIHCAGGPVEAESRIESGVLDDLEADGIVVDRGLEAYGSMAGAHVATTTDDRLDGGADPRREGHTLYGG